MVKIKDMQRIYLDYAASTPVDPAVLDAMKPYFLERFGNPGSLHAFGQEAIAAVDRSREAIGRAIGAEFRQIVFTGSATEANNLAIRGTLGAAEQAGFAAGRPRIVISAIEHESVLGPAREAERAGAEVVVVPVDAAGIVDEKKIEESLNERTALVSILYANNETGSVQPIPEIARAVASFRGRNRYPLFHTDAAQALQFLDCGAARLGADLMTLSAHKIYGPKGIGALFARDLKDISPMIHGGGQEFDVRSGTENVPSIAGFAKAIELALASRAGEAKRIGALRDHFWSGLKRIVRDAELNGPPGGPERLPNIINAYFPGRAAGDVLTALDLGGVAASSGSACRSRATGSSYVIRALGYGDERAKSSIRFSFGRPTTRGEIDAALRIIGRSLG